MIKTNELIESLRTVVSEDQIITSEAELNTRTTDLWPLRLVQRTFGREGVKPLCVVAPKNTEEVSNILALLNKNQINVVPYGGGSGVGGGSEPTRDSVVVDLKHMNNVLTLDPENLFVTVEPAVIMGDLERYLNKEGFISGHYPQSIELAQVGGLVATRSSGQFSTKYGNIEDLLLGLEAVLPNGEVIEINNIPRRSVGPDLRHIWLGSEGVFGIITKVSMKIFPKPEARWRQAYAFKTMREGLKAIQAFVQTGWNPAVVRLHDADEAEQKYEAYIEKGESVLLLLGEGPTGLVNAEKEGVNHLVLKEGGRVLGEQPVSEWLDHRNAVAKTPDYYTNQGLIIDTIEIAANWSDIADIYEEVTANLPQDIPELFLMTGHSSHSYAQGTNIYFIFGAKSEETPEAAAVIYEKIWQRVLDITLAHNGSICHHHGIGKWRAKWVPNELGSSYQLLTGLKKSLDPNLVLNQGTLIPN